MGGADGVAVTTLAEDLGAGVLVHGVIASEKDRTCRHKVIEEPASDVVSQAPQGPAAFTEDAVVAGAMARSQRAEGGKQVANGTAAKSKNTGQSEDEKAQESGVSESSGEGVEEGTSRVGQIAVKALKFPAGGAGLACSALTAFAIETACVACLTAVRGSSAVSGVSGVRGAVRRNSYNGHGSLLDVNVVLLYIHCITKALSLRPQLKKRAKVELNLSCFFLSG